MKYCAYCKKEFSNKRKDAIFCSKNCANNAAYPKWKERIKISARRSYLKQLII